MRIKQFNEFINENKQNESSNNGTYQVVTFNIVDKDLSYNDAFRKANELWNSGKYEGIQILNQDPNSEEPLEWIMTK